MSSILDLTAVLTSGYFCASVVVITALVILRRSLQDFLARVLKVSGFGATIEAHAPQPQDSATTSPESIIKAATMEPVDGSTSPRDAADELLRAIPRTPYLNFVEDELRKSLARLGVSADDKQMTRVLLSTTATFAIGNDFERINGMIWGSQIHILRSLGEAGALMAPAAFRPIYDAAKERWPDVYISYPFEKHIEFLKAQNLATLDNETIAITQKGRAFLVFLAQDGKPITRAY